MIYFEFKNRIATPESPELFTFKVELDPKLQNILKEHLIVKFCTIGKNNSEGWETKITPGCWVEWNGGGNSRWNVIVMDSNKNILFTREYNSLYDGSDLDKAFDLYCKINKQTKGIVIGSHDGLWGHWVQSVRDNETECLIIEGSTPQFIKLTENYSEYKNCTLINEIVTVKGGPVEWHTGGEGFTDSIHKDVNLKFLKNEEVKTEIKNSVSINDLIEKYNYQNYDWLHTDIEGYDAELIMGLKYLPKFIVFENEHSKTLGTYIPVKKYLEHLNYNVIEIGIDTLAVKQ